MRHPDEGMIHTWLDGELPAEEAAALEMHIAECEQCKASVAEARGFIAAASRIIGTLDNVPSGVIPAAKPVKRVWYSSPQFRAAAAVLIVAGASFLVTRPNAEKSALAVPGNVVMADAATAERIMSAPSPTVAAAPPVVQTPEAANQALSKKEAAKTVTAPPPPPRDLAVRGTPVREVGAARTTQAQRQVVNEADFSGKGVKGGSSTGVSGPTTVQDSTALSGRVAGVPMKAVDAMSARSDFRADQGDLKIVRVDSTATTRKTTYQSLSGTEVVLIEEAPAPVLSKIAASNDERRQRAASSESAVATSAPSAPAPVAQRAGPIQTITWVDPTTRKRYSLSGRVPVAELETIKARLLKTR